MNARARWALIALAVLPPGTAAAGYRSLAEGLENYEPPVLFRQQAQPPAAPQEVVSEGAGNDFRNQVEALEEARETWQEAVPMIPKEGAFYRPDPALEEALLPARDDAAAAEAELADGFSLSELECLVLLRNPAIRAAEDNLRAVVEQYSQAANLDEILRQYSAFTEALMTGIGPMKGREPVEMRFPFPSMLALKGDIVTQEVRAASETLEIARRSAVTAARKTAWNLLFVSRSREVTGEMVGLLRRLEDVATTRYETGETSFQDVIKVRIQRETLEEELKTIEERHENLAAKVRELTDLSPTATVGAPLLGQPDRHVPDLPPLQAAARETKQELRRMRDRVGKMELMIEMAETRIYPGYSLNLSVYEDEAVNQVGTFRMKEPFPTTTPASMGAGLPKMPWYGANDAYLRETRQKLQGLREQLRQMENATVFGVREAWFRLDQAVREEALFGESVVDLSQAGLEVSTRGYETGKVGFAEVINAYTTWLQSNLALERRRADVGVARADLEEAVGVSPLPAGSGR